MSGEPLAEAKRAANAFVSQLDLTTTAVGLIAFSDWGDVTQRATHSAVDIERAIRDPTVCSTGVGLDPMRLTGRYAKRLPKKTEGCTTGYSPRTSRTPHPCAWNLAEPRDPPAPGPRLSPHRASHLPLGVIAKAPRWTSTR
jgi:hypothetical protein